MMKCITFPKESGRCISRNVELSQFAWRHHLRDFAGYNGIAVGTKGYIASVRYEITSAPHFFSEVGDGAEWISLHSNNTTNL